MRRAVAQLAEHRSPKPAVEGSSPSCPAKFSTASVSRRPRGERVAGTAPRLTDRPTHPLHPLKAYAMSMNREQRRMMQRQGEVDAEGEPIRTRREAPQQRSKEERTSPLQFFRECRAELRKVAWPTRSETLNYTIVVVITITIVTVLVAGLDWLFSNSILELFDV